MSFDRYLKLFQDQLKYPTPGSHHFATDTIDGKYIGNCMYYDLDTVNLEAELGIVIGDREYWSNSYGYDAVITLLDHMFTARRLKRVYLHTLEWNKRAQRCFSKSGFKPVKMVRAHGLRLHSDGSAAGRLVCRRRGAAHRPVSKRTGRRFTGRCFLGRPVYPRAAATDWAKSNTPVYNACPTTTPSTPVPARFRISSSEVTPPEASTAIVVCRGQQGVGL